MRREKNNNNNINVSIGNILQDAECGVSGWK